MLVLAVQRFCDTAGVLAAHMAALGRFRRLYIGRRGLVVCVLCFRVTLRRMLMDALGHFRIAILRVFVAAWRSRRPLGVAAIRVMLRVMFAQAACICRNLPTVLCGLRFGKGRWGAEGKQQRAAEQQTQ